MALTSKLRGEPDRETTVAQAPELNASAIAALSLEPQWIQTTAAATGTDGDTRWDRAVGHLQFIAQPWPISTTSSMPPNHYAKLAP